MLRIIAGMLKPKRGHVSVCGREVKSYKDVIGNVIYLPSNPSVFLVGPKIIDDFNRAQVDEDLIDYFSAGRIVSERIFRVSEGERRLAAIMAALSYRVHIILLDEATIGLDKENRTKLMELLRDVGKKKLVLLATNDFRVLPFCDEILLLDDGRIKLRGPPDSIFDQVSQLSWNQTVQVYRALLRLGLNPKLTRDSLIKVLMGILCST